MAKKHESNSLAILFTNIADAARVAVLSQAMRGYKNDSILDSGPLEYILASLLGVDPDWIFLFERVYSGHLHGFALVGAEDHPGVVVGQAMMVQRHGFIQHPLMNRPAPIHPLAKDKIDLFVHGNVNGHTHVEKGWHGSCPQCLKDHPPLTQEEIIKNREELRLREKEDKERADALQLRSAWRPDK